KLIIEPTELLKKVPFFKDIPENEFKASASCMKQRLFSEGEFIIYQGEAGNSLFLIARGVVRVSREENGTKRDLATLFAGDFFGEMALLHNEPRSASIQAITSCTLYELSRYDLNRFVDFHPRIREALKEADQKRRSSIFLTENL
ncbi:MAG: cyclic nucleotide-binding domain-containing protein, partial [Elusimicrobiota bacterium]